MLAHSACHEKRSLISSVPHAVLDDKMATVAVHAVVMRNLDTTNFIYCRRAAWSVPHSSHGRGKQSFTLSPRDVPGATELLPGLWEYMLK